MMMKKNKSLLAIIILLAAILIMFFLSKDNASAPVGGQSAAVRGNLSDAASGNTDTGNNSMGGYCGDPGVGHTENHNLGRLGCAQRRAMSPCCPNSCLNPLYFGCWGPSLAWCRGCADSVKRNTQAQPVPAGN